MKTVQVQTNRCYPVIVGSGILPQITQYITAKKVCIISDDHVWPLYGNSLTNILSDAGIAVCHFLIPAGEASKNFENYHKTIQFLAENEITRTDHLIALGGGVVGDLAGFAAATYLRGISYIQVPTSLLAMVDASVGGKTGIDLPAGKNLCGAFWQPSAVLCDTDTCKTLPQNVFLDGCAEVIKYGVLFDSDLFAHLENTGTNFDPEAVISRCIALKCDVVANDEFDNGVRKLLNLGHTFGHAIEKCSDYVISHGKAVSIGMAMVARSTKCQDAQRIVSLLQQFGLPTSTSIPANKLYDAVLLDKKRSGDTIELILPHAIGECHIVPTPIHHLKTLIEEGI